MFIGRSRIRRARMVSLSQTSSDQISNAAAQEHARAQRSRAVRASLAAVLPDAHQLPFGHPRNAEDVGHGTLLEWLPLKGRRVLDSGLGRVFRKAARGISEKMGS
jgi:hypothetical protein